MPIREICAGTMEGPTCPWTTPKPPPFSCAGAHIFSASEVDPRWTASPHTKRRKSIIRPIPASPLPSAHWIQVRPMITLRSEQGSPHFLAGDLPTLSPFGPLVPTGRSQS